MTRCSLLETERTNFAAGVKEADAAAQSYAQTDFVQAGISQGQV